MYEIHDKITSADISCKYHPSLLYNPCLDNCHIMQPFVHKLHCLPDNTTQLHFWWSNELYLTFIRRKQHNESQLLQSGPWTTPNRKTRIYTTFYNICQAHNGWYIDTVGMKLHEKTLIQQIQKRIFFQHNVYFCRVFCDCFIYLNSNFGKYNVLYIYLHTLQ